MTYLLKGLGYKGLAKTEDAKNNLQRAVELSVGNPYASLELKEL